MLPFVVLLYVMLLCDVAMVVGLYSPQASKLLVWYFSRCVWQFDDDQCQAKNLDACRVYVV